MNASTHKQQVLGNYKIGKSIGEGTFGKVRLGFHILTEEKVAVKTLQKEKIIQQSDIERVTRQICILKILRHPNIIQLYEIIQTKTDIHLIMEYAEGGQLFDYIVKNKRIQQTQAVKFTQQILSGVQYIHKNGIVHRDLKPQNLLLDSNKNIKIVDFGLSNQYKVGQKLKTACGSPCYAAPQMIAGKRYQCLNVDIWSCGIIIYAMLCGYLPFEDKNTNKLYKKIIAGDFQMPKILSSQARDILKNILNVNPDTRYKVSQIRGSRWYNLSKQKYQAKGIIVGKDKIIIDDIVIREMQKNKFQQVQTRSYVQNNRHNHITAAYYLYKKKFQRDPPKQNPKQITKQNSSKSKDRDDSPLIYKPQKKPDYYIPQPSKKQKDVRDASRNDSINASNIISSLVEANKNKLINPKFSRKPQNGNFDKVQDFKLFPNKMNSSIYDPNSSIQLKGITNPSKSVAIDDQQISNVKKISFTSNDIRRNSFGAGYATQLQSTQPINKKRQQLSEQLKQISVKIDKQIVELKKQNEEIQQNKKKQFTQSTYLTINSDKHRKRTCQSFNIVNSKQKIKLSKDLNNQSVQISNRQRIVSSHIPTSTKSALPKQHVGPFNVRCLFMQSATILFRKIVDFFKLNNLQYTSQQPYEIKTTDNHSIWIQSISGSAGLYLVNFSGSMPINEKILQVLTK